ncbi:MAG: hypothetical protein N4A45_01440 [Flavobacteriales bacterium]|jgi:hypothetical protein|nr:hypothetical protein [Flavobacteriales bacterium]
MGSTQYLFSFFLMIFLVSSSTDVYSQNKFKPKNHSAKELYYILNDKKVYTCDSAIFFFSKGGNRSTLKGFLFKKGRYRKYTYQAGRVSIDMFSRKNNNIFSASNVTQYSHAEINPWDTTYEAMIESVVFDYRIVFVDFINHRLFSAQSRAPHIFGIPFFKNREYLDFRELFHKLTKLHPKPNLFNRDNPALKFYHLYEETEIFGTEKKP